MAAGIAVAFAVLLAGDFGVGADHLTRFSSLIQPDEFVNQATRRLVAGFNFSVTNIIGAGLGYTSGVPSFIRDPIFQDLPTTNMDSGYAAAALELGVVGLFIFVFFAWKVGVEGFLAWRRLPPGVVRDLLLAPALWAATYPILLVVAQPQATLPSSIYHWLLIGVLMRASAEAPTPEGATVRLAHRVRRRQLTTRLSPEAF